MIRLARTSDLDAIEAALPVIVLTMRASGNDQWGPLYPTRLDFGRDLEAGTLFVDDRGAVRGFAVFDEHEPPAYDALPWTVPRPALVVHRLAVVPEFRRLGVADGLFSFAEARARALGRGLRSDTAEANEGMKALFAKRGWRRVGTLRFPHSAGEFVAWERPFSS